MRSTVLAVLLFLCLASLSQAAKLDTAFTFSTIETPHFSIHFHQGLEAVARKAALFAEQAHAELTREFIWVPQEKTQLVLIDDSDFSNGLTVTIPYNTIYIETVPPSLASTLGEYDDWLREIITHEYAHVVTSDAARGYSKVTRAIFGKPLPWTDPFTELLFFVTAPPNTFMPRWWHEGMATWSETQFTGAGRGKGSYFDMVFRTAVAENYLPRVDEINGDVPFWPNGDLPYLYGYRLQKYIADTYGKEALGKLSMANAGRFPYFNEAPPKELLGKDFRHLYDDMIQAVRTEQSQKIAILSGAPFTPLTTISRAGELLTNPRFSPDGSRIAYTRVDPHDHTMTVITDATGKTELAKFRRLFSDEANSWSPDGGTVYFTQAEINRGFDTYQDLYAYDLAADSTRRLTHFKRLSNADLSPDGKRFAAVVSSRGSQNLALIDLLEPGKKVGEPRMVTGYSLEHLSSPRWSPDGKTICYALRDNVGHTTVRLYDTATGSDSVLFGTGYTLDYPVWSRDGSCIFYICDETGVFNLFAWDLKAAKSYQVSHLLTGALQPDPSPDGRALILSHYGSRGFSIAQLTLDRSKWSEKRGPSLPPRREIAAPLPTTADKSGKFTTYSSAAPPPGAGRPGEGLPPTHFPLPSPPPPGEGTGTVDDGVARAKVPAASHYNALDTVYPHFWLPRVTDDGSGQSVLGAFTAGADVLGYNSYAVTADYSPGRSRGYFDLIYQNDYFYPTLSLLAHAEPFLYSNLQQRGDYWELNQGLTAQMSVPINFLETRYLFNLGYQLLDQKALSALDSSGRFNGVSVFQGRRDNVFAGFDFDDVLKYPYSISSEEGCRISLLYKRFAQAIGSSIDMSEYSAQYEQYLRMPGEALKHHVVYLRLSGAASDGSYQEAYQIGGVPSDLNEFPLRGYGERSATGKYAATGTLEYRAPLFYPMRGPGTLPVFLEKIHAALFVDAGEVWSDHNAFDGNNAKVGAGVELRYDVTLGYWAKVTPALGFAHGFSRDGENQLYFTLYIAL